VDVNCVHQNEIEDGIAKRGQVELCIAREAWIFTNQAMERHLVAHTVLQTILVGLNAIIPSHFSKSGNPHANAHTSTPDL
jgi:hypothetical protein